MVFLSDVVSLILTDSLYTAEVSKLLDAKFLQICFDEETNLVTYWMAFRRVSTFLANFHFVVNYSSSMCFRNTFYLE